LLTLLYSSKYSFEGSLDVLGRGLDFRRDGWCSRCHIYQRFHETEPHQYSLLDIPADLNPIELMWSKIKSILRKLKAWTAEELLDATGIALNEVTYEDILGWFEYDGYIVNV
jgi:hypothetical protein